MSNHNNKLTLFLRNHKHLTDEHDICVKQQSVKVERPMKKKQNKIKGKLFTPSLKKHKGQHLRRNTAVCIKYCNN